jgi:hypothetical protein
MSITAEAPRGGVVEYIGGTSYTFILRNREIERFEDKHRGIFELWDGFFGKGKKPSSREVRDILALGLVGGGKKDHEADRIILAAQPEDLLRLYSIAQAVLGVAFMPDAMTEGEVKKKNSEDQPQDALTSEE